MLKNLDINSSINSSQNDLVNDFFKPLLKSSKSYCRGVGFFSSGWLKINFEGLVEFANNGGNAKWITSPILSKEDWEAMKIGNEAKINDNLRNILSKNIINLSDSLEKDTLSALAWMVADGLLEFRLAITRGKLDGEFHDKFGIFEDVEGNQVSFSGSYNESIQGTRNYESFKVFKSWIPEQENWVKDDIQRFNHLWSNKDPNIKVLDIGQSNRDNIIKFRIFDRPYKTGESKESIKIDNNQTPRIELRDYQKKAIEKWFENNCQGFFEMATGTGKTFTALAATKQLLENEKRLAVVITVPYQHLVEQWNLEAQKFGIISILAYKSKELWINRLNSAIIEYNNGFRNFLCVIVTHVTFVSSSFQATIKRLEKPALVIADEAHHLGTEIAQKAYPHNILYRLALSATPNRWYDDEGTNALREYFGKTVFDFPLKDAIGISLTPYYYYPVLVNLTSGEIEQYEDLSAKIAKLFSRGSKNGNIEDRLKFLLLKRSDILNKAQNKIQVLSKLLDENIVKKHTLFYCAPGQIDEVLKLVGAVKGILVHPFTSWEDTDQRKQLLKDFAEGNLQALAAIRCLDEGVDVPNTETAYLLASSSNPREFIQRRGRILRKAEGKKQSYLYDLITIPPEFNKKDKNESTFALERNIIKRELSRFKEFAEHSKNKHQAIDIIWEIAKKYEIMDF